MGFGRRRGKEEGWMWVERMKEEGGGSFWREEDARELPTMGCRLKQEIWAYG
jgi:hypothetical protein